jgi:tetratricopeptide (TPR) repeat protein
MIRNLALLSSLFLTFEMFSGAFPERAVWALDAEAVLAEGDHLYDSRDEADHAEKAISIYKKLLEADPKNEGMLWRLSRSYRWQGDVAASSDDKLAAYLESEKWAERAIEADPASVGGHLMLGIAYGRIGETKGVLKSLSLVSPIKREMGIVLSLDPKNDIAHHVLGVLYRKVPGLMGGSIKKSIEALQAAVDLNRSGTTHQLELARSYLEKGKTDQAKVSLQDLLAISDPSDRVQSKKDRAEAEALLADLESE